MVPASDDVSPQAVPVGEVTAGVAGHGQLQVEQPQPQITDTYSPRRWAVMARVGTASPGGAAVGPRLGAVVGLTRIDGKGRCGGQATWVSCWWLVS